MRIHLSDPHLVPSLVAFLRERAYVVAERVGPHEVEVSQLGSENASGRRLELDLILQVWRASPDHAETQVEITEVSPGEERRLIDLWIESHGEPT